MLLPVTIITVPELKIHRLWLFLVDVVSKISANLIVNAPLNHVHLNGSMFFPYALLPGNKPPNHQLKMIWTKLFRVTCICFVFSACVGVRPVFFGSKKTSKTKTKAQNEKTSTKYGVSLCRTINIQQEINIEGCGLKRIRNKACMGKCGSYYLPSKMNLVLYHRGITSPT